MNILHCKAEELVDKLEDNSVRLLLTDPPFYGIVSEDWDNQWEDSAQFSSWLYRIFRDYERKLTPDGSIVFFAGLGKHGIHPLFSVVNMMETTYTFRNWITWKKRRAYGKSHDYLYCREEILWFSKSPERKEVVFNIPLLQEKRGYAGFDKKYPAKSEFKRVSNVWTDIENYIPDSTVIEDIPELMRPKRSCEKPIALMERLVATHSNEGDLVVDCFAGTGATGKACENLNRRFIGCDVDKECSQ